MFAQFAMGKPFVACPEGEPELRWSRDMSTSPDFFRQSGKLDSAAAMVMTESAPPQDALQAAESYFQQVRETSSRKSNGHHGPRRTLFELLVDDTDNTARFAPTQQRNSTGEMLGMQSNNSELSSEDKSRTSTGRGDIDLEASLSEFSLDNSTSSPHVPMFSPSAELERTVSPAQTNSDLETPSEFSQDDSDTCPHELMCPPSIVSSLESGVLQDNKEIVQRWSLANVQGVHSQSLDGESGRQAAQNSLEPVELEDGQIEEIHDPQERLSKSEFEWTAVLRRSARSLDSISHESFKTSRSAAISSTSSRGSLSDEAISERASSWGNGVARLVLKNSSRESTPRTSNGSSIDGLQYGQKVPGVAKHVRDALSSFQLAFVVCDVIDPEKPILYASAGFFNMTGYSPEEIVGRNCRFLQGGDTDAKEVTRISNALKKGEAYSGTILNYKKNGAPFWNLLTLSPISDDKGVVIKYMGMQAEVNNRSMTARRKKTALEGHSKDVPMSVSESINEEIAQASNAPSKKSEHEDDVPIFTPPSASRGTAACDPNGKSQGSKRYSLTYGTGTPSVRGRSVELRSGGAIGGSERYPMPSEKKRSLGPQQRPAKTSSARPFYWLLTAAQMLEEEIHQLGCNPNAAAKEHNSQTIRKHEESDSGLKNQNKISRVAKCVYGLFRKLERKVFKRTARAPSNRVSAYNFESDVDIDDFPELPIMNDYYSKRQDARCESMPHINWTRAGSSLTSLLQADLRARSSRYVPSATSDTPSRKTSTSHTDEFILDRQQFCIVHE